MTLIKTVLATLCLYVGVPRAVVQAADQPTEPVVLLKLGTAIEDRNVVETTSFAAGETAIAWTQVQGIADGAIVHVWYRDGVEIARHTLDVKSAKRWRTWSRMRLVQGVYKIQIETADGTRLGETAFEVPETLDEEEGC
jgi:Protein of unknown function (DUF2914)